jgi:hypothetical protein
MEVNNLDIIDENVHSFISITDVREICTEVLEPQILQTKRDLQKIKVLKDEIDELRKENKDQNKKLVRFGN